MNPVWVVVMGVSGSGKSTVGARLAQALGVEFVEGDTFHPPANVARMAAGVPLTDADRAGWLDALAARLEQTVAERHGLVMSCSALKRAYRDRLRRAAPLRFVALAAPAALLEQRLSTRTGHYMPASLLTSQLATLEPPQPDERAITVDSSLPVDTIVERIIAQLQPPAPTHEPSVNRP